MFLELAYLKTYFKNNIIKPSTNYYFTLFTMNMELYIFIYNSITLSLIDSPPALPSPPDFPLSPVSPPAVPKNPRFLTPLVPRPTPLPIFNRGQKRYSDSDGMLFLIKQKQTLTLCILS